MREVWLIDGTAHLIEVVTCDGGRLARDDQLARSDVIADFELTPNDLFAQSDAQDPA